MDTMKNIIIDSYNRIIRVRAKKTYWFLGLAVFMAITFAFSNINSASVFQEKLRVGLKELYEGKATITIANKTLVLGYNINDKWQSENVFTSDNGYIFKPATDIYVASNETFSDYIECNEVAITLKEKGFDTVSANISTGIWKVYIKGAKNNDEAEKIKAEADAGTHLSFTIYKDNALRTIMNFSEGEVLMENEIAQAAFKTNDILKGVYAISLGSRSYRGIIEIGRYGKSGVTAINVIDMEEYLYGVVPSEMYSSWPKEALKAQAVAARSYAYYNAFVARKYPKEKYMICDTVISQAYKGFSSEAATCNQAVNETAGKAIYYAGNVIPAVFFSTSGGHTEDSQNVWGGTVAYLKGVPDSYENEPAAQPWSVTLTASQIKNKLAAKGIDIGEILDLKIDSYSTSGRAMTMTVIGETGEYKLVKETISSWMGLKSRKFTLIRPSDKANTSFLAVNSAGKNSGNLIGAYVVTGTQGTVELNTSKDQIIAFSDDNSNSIALIQGKPETYIFIGQGYGHGVGMSQSGAKGMAKKGYNYKQILEYYYKGVEIK